MAESKSLASLASTGFVLPTVLAQPTAPVISGLNWAPYITFAHPARKDEWAKLQAKFGIGLREGNMYYLDGAEIVHLDELKCGYLTGLQHWVERSPSGELLKFSRFPQPDPFREHVEAVVLVYLKDKVVPANITFRTTKCGAAKTMDETLRLASDPVGWGKLSPTHQATVPIPQPFFRFFASIRLSAPRTSKRSGLPYSTLVASVFPTTSTEVVLLRAMIDDPDMQAKLGKAAERYKYVMDELETACID